MTFSRLCDAACLFSFKNHANVVKNSCLLESSVLFIAESSDDETTVVKKEKKVDDKNPLRQSVSFYFYSVRHIRPIKRR